MAIDDKRWMKNGFEELNQLYKSFNEVVGIYSVFDLFCEGLENNYKEGQKEELKNKILDAFSYYKDLIDSHGRIVEKTIRRVNNHKEFYEEYKKESKRVYLLIKENIDKTNKEMEYFKKKYEC